MKAKLMPYIRIAGFSLCLLLLIAFANKFLLQTDTVAFLTIREMQQSEDIDLAIVGSSVVRDHFDPYLISEQTGLTAFDAAIPTANFQTKLAITEELFKTNSPEYVVMICEPYSLNSPKESLEAQYKLMPVLSGLDTQMRYYLRLCREDHNYLDRLLLFRVQMASSLKEVAKTFGLWLHPEETFERVKENMEKGSSYMGRGYLRYDVPPMTAEYMRLRIGRLDPTRWEWNYPLLPSTERSLLEYKSLCEENGAKLLIIIHPMHAGFMLYHPDFIPYNASLMRFCEENGIECYNFSYAKPEFIPNLDPYFFDYDHMNAEGSRILSEAFSDFMNLYRNGEDVSRLFYANQYEYQDSIDYIPNCWVLPIGDGRYEADCLRTPLYTPEYRFMLVTPEGKETLLRDYSTDAIIDTQIPEGYNLRVYARLQGKEQNPAIYYSYPSDFVAHYGEALAPGEAFEVF